MVKCPNTRIERKTVVSQVLLLCLLVLMLANLLCFQNNATRVAPSSIGPTPATQRLLKDSVSSHFKSQGSDVDLDSAMIKSERISQRPKTIAPRSADKPFIFFVWLGKQPLEGLYKAAIESCRVHNQDDFTIRVIEDADLANPAESLGFELHPLFHLLDPVQKSDYLRQELLHFHGGVYLDADVFCVRPLARTLQRIGKEGEKGQIVVGGGAPHLPHGDLNNNMLGPNVKLSSYSSDTHEALWKRLDSIGDQLRACAKKHPDGNGGIAYSDRVMFGKQLCGTKWGVMIDFNKKKTRKAYADGVLVPTFQRCEKDSAPGSCDLVHVGCAKARSGCREPSFVCARTPALRDTSFCAASAAAA